MISFRACVALAFAVASLPVHAAQTRPAIIQAAIERTEQQLAETLPALTTPAARADAIGEVAMLYHAQEQLPAAVARYRRAIAAHEAVRWHYLLGAALADQGDLDAAASAYRRAIELAPSDGMAHYRLGTTLMLRGDHQAAAGALREALVTMPDNAAVLAALGEAAAATGDLAAARRHLERAAALAPNAGRVAYRLGVVYRDLGQEKNAARWFERRNDVAPTVADPRLLAVAQRSLSPKFFVAAGNRAKARGDWPEALAAFERAQALAPSDVAAGLGRADALHALGEVEAALAATEALVAQAPEVADAWLLHAFLLHRSDRLTTALAAAEESVSLRSDRAGRTLLAALLMRGGQFRQAAAAYQQLTTEFPNAAYFRYWLAMAHFGAGDCRSGRESMAAALAQQPNWGQAHIALCRATALCGEPEALPAARERAAALMAAADNVDTRLTAAFVALREGRSADVRRAANAALPHPDAEALLAALDADRLPAAPFAPGSTWWLPPELAAAPSVAASAGEKAAAGG